MSAELPSSGTRPEDGPTAEKLRAYVEANGGRFTDEAITSELVRAGYAPDDIRAALAEAASRGPQVPPRRQAVRTILAAYGITFAILSLGMMANGRVGGHGLPNAPGGIAILAASLGVALVLSLIWIASRRNFAIVVAVILGIAGASGIGSIQGLVMLAIAVGIGVLAVRAPSSMGTAAAGLIVLLVVPVLLLLVVGGLCVASGLPIPRAG